MYDLLDAPMGKIYADLAELDRSGRRFGRFPLFALTRTGNLLASGFCERMISAGNLVMPKGRTVLSDVVLRKTVLLKMNRKYMEHMKKEHPELAGKMTQKYEDALLAHLAKTADAGPKDDAATTQDAAGQDPAAAAQMWHEVMNFASNYFDHADAAAADAAEAEEPNYNEFDDPDVLRIMEETDMSQYDDVNLAYGLQACSIDEL